MRAKIIVLSGHAESFKHADACNNSSITVENNFQIERFLASEPKDVDQQMSEFDIKWNYPWNGEEVNDFASGMVKTGYQTAEPKKRIACFLSHYRLWKECAEGNEPYLILEHDAIFTRKLDVELLKSSPVSIISINQPQSGATPQALVYEQAVVKYGGQKGSRIVPVPLIKAWNIPQGLPGNSAYWMKPKGAQIMLELVDKYGAWPNDAIMCKQLVGHKNIGCLYPFSTRVQSTLSTTTL